MPTPEDIRFYGLAKSLRTFKREYAKEAAGFDLAKKNHRDSPTNETGVALKRSLEVFIRGSSYIKLTKTNEKIERKFLLSTQE